MVFFRDVFDVDIHTYANPDTPSGLVAAQSFLMNSFKVVHANNALLMVHLQLPLPGTSLKTSLFVYDGCRIWRGYPALQSCEPMFKEAFMAPSAGNISFETFTEDLGGHVICWWYKQQPHERHSVPLTLLELEEMHRMIGIFQSNIAKMFLADGVPASTIVAPSDAAALLKGLQDDPCQQEAILEGCCKLLKTRACMITALRQDQATADTDAIVYCSQGVSAHGDDSKTEALLGYVLAPANIC